MDNLAPEDIACMYIVMSIKSYKLELPLILLEVLPNLEYLKSDAVAEPCVNFLLIQS